MSVSKRVMRDVQTMVSDEMRSLDIHYWYDESDLSIGTGLLFGPESTPYAYCPLFFSVKIPNDYPFNPPQVFIMTSDGVTRLHPNLYVGGKVCLSILGTYSGPSWASTMNIGTVFKSIFSILNDNPIINEPGWERYTLADEKARAYAEWVEYNILKMTIKAYINYRLGRPSEWRKFKDVFDGEQWTRKWQKIEEIVTDRIKTGDKTYTGIPYGMSGTTIWGNLLNGSSN